MKALSVKQPWANLIADGSKTIETRSWATKYRGPLLIVSSRRPLIHPAGYALAIVELTDCRPMRPSDGRLAYCELYPGAFAWLLRNIHAIEPFPIKGSLGLYDADLGAAAIAIQRELSRLQSGSSF